MHDVLLLSFRPRLASSIPELDDVGEARLHGFVEKHQGLLLRTVHNEVVHKIDNTAREITEQPVQEDFVEALLEGVVLVAGEGVELHRKLLSRLAVEGLHKHLTVIGHVEDVDHGFVLEAQIVVGEQHAVNQLLEHDHIHRDLL